MTPEKERVADIDLLSNIEINGSLEGLQAQFANLGLFGSIDNYFDYKLTDVRRPDITFADAQKIFDQRSTQHNCFGWRMHIRKWDWGIYQIQSISVGNIHFGRSSGFQLASNAEAKLKLFEPELRAAVKK